MRFQQKSAFARSASERPDEDSAQVFEDKPEDEENAPQQHPTEDSTSPIDDQPADPVEVEQQSSPRHLFPSVTSAEQATPIQQQQQSTSTERPVTPQPLSDPNSAVLRRVSHRHQHLRGPRRSVRGRFIKLTLSVWLP